MITFDWTVNVSDLLTLTLVVSGFIALHLQARSVKLAEIDLQAKVEDIQNLIQQLEAERRAREAQISERIDKEVELMNYTSYVSAQSQSIQRDSHGITINLIETLATALWVLSRPQKNRYETSTMPDERLEAISGACTAVLEVAALDQSWTQELKNVSKASDARRKSLSVGEMPLSGYAARLESEIGRSKKEIEDANERMNQTLAVSGERYQTARAQLIAAINSMAHDRNIDLVQASGTPNKTLNSDAPD